MKTIRENLEQWEESYLSPYATLSTHSKGRKREEEPCDIRPVFQRDRDRILHCTSFRGLKDKTQVFIAPKGDHYRTRLTHTLEVSQIARTIARALQLNEELTDAIALGHDLGHTPFGHAGERALNRVCPYPFRHNEQSLRTVELLEKDGQGLNLTYEVLDGIVNHEMRGCPQTLEGCVVRFSDKIAYLHHDCDDAVRAGILKESDIPEEISRVAGRDAEERLDHFIHDLIVNSAGRNEIRMSPEMEEALMRLRTFMYERVYSDPLVEQEVGKAEKLVETLYDYYVSHPDELAGEFQVLLQHGREPLEKVVCDAISSMSDRYAVACYEELFIPKSWSVL